MVLALATLAWACESGPAPTSPTATPTFTLSGLVRDGQSALAVDGAQVHIVAGPGTGMSANTNSAGEFRLGSVPAGAVTLRALKDGYLATDRTITIDGNLNLEILLIATAAVLPPPNPEPAPTPPPGPTPPPATPPPATPPPATPPPATPAPAPPPPAPMFKFSGQVIDRAYAPLRLGGVEIRTDKWTAVTDATGRYEIHSPSSVARLLSVAAPDSYEACRDIVRDYCENKDFRAGLERVFDIWRVASFELRLTAPSGGLVTPTNIKLGNFACVDPRVHYDGDLNPEGWGGRLPPSRLPVSTSNATVASVGANVECSYGEVRGVAPGTAVITLATRYAGVAAPPLTIHVVP
jgi:hypothetical protein